jgi:hypothetical protein
MSTEWTFMRGCQECGSVVRWLSEAPAWCTDEFGRYTACPVCENRLYLKEGRVPTSENLREWIACFVEAGSTLSDAVVNLRAGDRRTRDAEQALEAWDALLREWNQGMLTPAGRVRSTIARTTKD